MQKAAVGPPGDSQGDALPAPRLHRVAGVALARLLRRRRARKDTLNCIEFFSRDAHGGSVRWKAPRPTGLPRCEK